MTTLTEARRAALKLSESLPEGSTYAAQLAVLSDYLDNQVPLNIENSNLRQHLFVAEGFVREVYKQSGRMVEAMTTAASESCVKALGYCRCPACIKPAIFTAVTPPCKAFGYTMLTDAGKVKSISELNDEGVCTKEWWKGRTKPYHCECLACRVRANA